MIRVVELTILCQSKGGGNHFRWLLLPIHVHCKLIGKHHYHDNDDAFDDAFFMTLIILMMIMITATWMQ